MLYCTYRHLYRRIGVGGQHAAFNEGDNLKPASQTSQRDKHDKIQTG